jgi:hypothetical protein
MLDVSKNNIGEVVLVGGIKHAKAKSGRMLYWDKDGKSLGAELPLGCGPLGVIAIANGIRDMRLLISLDLSSSKLTGDYGAEMSGNVFYT